MHLECKYLLLHDGLGRARVQVQLHFLGSDTREYGSLAKKAGTVGQFRAVTDQGSGQQPLRINDSCRLIRICSPISVSEFSASLYLEQKR
jgi:hypothetical protein